MRKRRKKFKKLKMVFRWVMISVILQVIVLSYLNFIYLPGRGNVRATIYEVEAAALKNRSLNLPEGAEDVSVSYDGRYAAYRLGDELVIADIGVKKTIKTLKPEGGTFTYFGWLPDREMLIYSIKEPDGKKGQVKVSTYDIGPELERSYPNIKGLPKGSGIIDIELSPLTNIVYPMIKTGKTGAKIYKYDIMDNLNFVMDTDTSTVIKETMYADNLIYQLPDGKIRIRNGKTGKLGQIPIKEAKLLLDTDDNDIIYTGAVGKDGRITAIFYGKAGQKAEEWKSVIPERPLSASDVFITADGGIYAADKQGKVVQSLTDSCVTEYKGELLTVLDDYMVSKDGNKLLLGILEKQR